MQKKLIALAIAGLVSAPVFAQSNVTVYGVADLTVDVVKANDKTPNSAFDPQRTKLDSNSSLLGFKGVEDLGNGLKALFQFETTVTADTGGFGVGRDTFAALSSGMGTLVLGNLTHPIRAMGSKVDLNPGATGIGFLGATYETFAGVKTGTGDRQQLVAYVTPSFSGLTGTIAYGPGEVVNPPTTIGGLQTAELKPFMWQIAGQYENGPIYVGLGYHEARDFRFVTPLTESKHTDVRLAGKYTFAFGTTISGLWDRQEIETDSFGPISGQSVRRNAWALNIGHSFGPHTIHGGYSRADDLSCDNCGDTASEMWTIGYEYALSKRTMIKAVYADLRNDKSANVDFYTAPVGSFSGAFALSNGTGSASSLNPGADPRGFGIGIRHSF